MLGKKLDLNQQNKKTALTITVIATLLISILAFYSFEEFNGLEIMSNEENNIENEDIGTSYGDEGDLQQTNQRPSALYNITDNNNISPYEHIVRPGESVRILNSRNLEVELEFDRKTETHILEPGEHKDFKVTKINYFEIRQTHSNSSTTAKINVQ